MPQNRVRRNHSRVSKDKQWTEVHNLIHNNAPQANLARLIMQDAPLQAHTLLVMMYGPFQAEMLPEEGSGIASWIQERIRRHGLPSLIRFGYRHRAQVFRRDQFQALLEPLAVDQGS